MNSYMMVEYVIYDTSILICYIIYEFIYDSWKDMSYMNSYDDITDQLSLWNIFFQMDIGNLLGIHSGGG